LSNKMSRQEREIFSASPITPPREVLSPHPLGRELYFSDLRELPASSERLTRKEEAELVQKITQGDQSARNKLIESQVFLVVSLAKKYQGRGLDLEDLIQTGNLGLVLATNEFDPNRGKFSTCAGLYVEREIELALAREEWALPLYQGASLDLKRLVRTKEQLTQEQGETPGNEELAQATEITQEKTDNLLCLVQTPESLDETRPDRKGKESRKRVLASPSPSPEEVTMRRMMKQAVRQTLRSLPPEEKQTLEHHLGFNGHEPQSLAELGRKSGRSRERLSQITKRALARLRHPRYTRQLKDWLPGEA